MGRCLASRVVRSVKECMRGDRCVWRDSFWALHTGPVFPLTTTRIIFYFKEVESDGPLSKGSVNTNVIYVSINVQWVWLWAHICSHSTAASPQNLCQYVREAFRVSPRMSPMLQHKSAEFLLSQPPRQVQTAACGPPPQWGSAWLVNLSRDLPGDLSTRAPWRPMRSCKKGAPLPNSVLLCHLGSKLNLYVPWMLQSLHDPSSFNPKRR